MKHYWLNCVQRRMLKTVVLCMGSASLVTGCAVINPYFDATKKHHTPTGFINNHPVSEVDSVWEIIKWQVTKLLEGGTPKPSEFVNGYAGFPVVKPDLIALKKNCSTAQSKEVGRCKNFSITWIGHATALVQMGGLNVLTDPMFSERASISQIGRAHV